MKQTAAAPEKMDPLTRIQEEIKEVVRREQEHKQFISGIETNIDENNEIVQNIDSAEPLSMRSTDDELILDENSNNKNVSFNAEHHSDDSGISGSSSPVHGNSTNGPKTDLKLEIPKEVKYIRPNCYNMTPEPPQQKLIKTILSPQPNGIKNRKFNMGPAQKGLMQRFIASRGKIQINNDNNLQRNILLSQNSVMSLVHKRPSLIGKAPSLDAQFDNEFRSVPLILDPTSTTTRPSSIERDEEGRPKRPGFVPVEVKIQRELRDLKSRESELKKLRKTRQSTPDLLNALEDEDSDDDYTEHCFGPNKLRGTKSISELNDSSHYANNSISLTNGDSKRYSDQHTGLKPAVSLAQLCDVDPDEAPSSHRLIAQWESIIQKNA